MSNKLSFHCSGNGYACASIDAQSLINCINRQFPKLACLQEIIRWTKGNPEKETVIGGFSLRTTERR